MVFLSGMFPDYAEKIGEDYGLADFDYEMMRWQLVRAFPGWTLDDVDGMRLRDVEFAMAYLAGTNKASEFHANKANRPATKGKRR